MKIKKLLMLLLVASTLTACSSDDPLTDDSSGGNGNNAGEISPTWLEGTWIVDDQKIDLEMEKGADEEMVQISLKKIREENSSHFLTMGYLYIHPGVKEYDNAPDRIEGIYLQAKNINSTGGTAYEYITRNDSIFFDHWRYDKVEFKMDKIGNRLHTHYFINGKDTNFELIAEVKKLSIHTYWKKWK